MSPEYEEEVLEGEEVVLEGEEVEESGDEGFYEEELDSEGLGAEIREQLKAAPWYILSAFAHMIVLILLMLIPTSPEKKKRAAIVISTKVVEEEKVEEEEEEEELEEIDPLEEIMENTSETTDTVVETKVETDVEVDTDIEIDDISEVSDPTEDDIADAAEDLTPKLMGVRTSMSGGALSSGFRGNVANIGKGLKNMLGSRKGGGRGLLLVWLLDQSSSMKDDQMAIAKQALDIQDLLTDGGSKKMMSSVVIFGKKWQVTQRPTSSASKIQEKIRTVPIDKSGVENTNQAIIFACQKIMSNYRDYTKVIVLLSDESSSDNAKYYTPPAKPKGKAGAKAKTPSKKKDDPLAINVSSKDRKIPLIEVALKNLVRYRTRLFVIGKESPFQSNYVREPYKDENGKVWPRVYASRGPETARIEVPIYYAQNTSAHTRSFTGKIKAGYGVYDLSYLAKGSRGAYFILEDKTTTVRRAMTFSERMRKPLVVDWKVMDSYKPDIVSRASYDSKMISMSKYSKAVVQLNKFYANAKSIQRWYYAWPPSTYKSRLACLQKRKKVVGKVIKFLSDKRASDKELFAAKNKRHIANIDLFYCVALADQIITEAWVDAWETYKGSTENYAVKGWGSRLQIAIKKGATLNAKDKEIYDTRMKTLVEACNDVVRRHPNTPYAIAANWLPRGAMRWGRPGTFVYFKWKHKKWPPRPKQ